MMDFSLTKEQQELISSVKNMASKEITPFALQAGETEKKKMLKSLARMNLLCPTVPKEFGGLGLGLVSSA